MAEAPTEIRIETERLLLRLFEPDDLEEMCSIWGDPFVTRFLPGGKPFPRERVASFLPRTLEFWREHGFGQLAVVHRETGRVIGYCGFKFLEETPDVELLYGLARAYWNQGLTTEAAAACLRFAFEETALERICAIAQPGNVGSYRVMEKLGMKFEKAARFDQLDVLYYSITRARFQPGRAKYILRAG
ncbi:MAG TPA: GNAT family N-acetyltransferase [Pyrinomonadaceae bacterium]|jgi:ribosomal-protein-alanine N-acetyltransferase